VDVLFRSLAAGPAREAAAVLLSGMGRDGAEGLLELRKHGAMTIVQAEATCAVAGMPRAALQLAAADIALSPIEIGRLIGRLASEAP
jgi:two-component system chemotaxis response regulator CheB